jgi:hypothetical protein
LDELLGHSGSTPHVNWLAEKERIKALCWWDEVMEKVGLPEDGKVYHFHPVGVGGNFSAAIDDNDLSWLKVPFGQLTFDVEGNDIEDPNNPLYRYFSRVVHWPGGASGITIGRGYDLGQRPSPSMDLSAAGIEEPLRSWLIRAGGLKGQAAKDYFDIADADIKAATISRKQQHDLFIPIYESMRNEVIRISRKTDVSSMYGHIKWETLDKKIKDVMIDLRYRGDYTSDARKIVQKYIVDNDFANFSKAISSRENWTSVPEDRFNKRFRYLED